MLAAALWQQNQDLAQACLQHPFVRQLRDGTLSEAIFRGYIAQDAFFLEAFARAYALALSRSEDSEAIGVFHDLIGGVRQELQLHAAYATELNIDLNRVRPNPACRAYTDFLLATAWQRSLAETLAAITPCMRLYLYLGEKLLQEIGGAAEVATHRYGRWISTYNDPEFQKLNKRLDGLVERFADDTSAVRSAYRYAMHCELEFFSDAFEPPRENEEIAR